MEVRQELIFIYFSYILILNSVISIISTYQLSTLSEADKNDNLCFSSRKESSSENCLFSAVVASTNFESMIWLYI